MQRRTCARAVATVWTQHARHFRAKWTINELRLFNCASCEQQEPCSCEELMQQEHIDIALLDRSTSRSRIVSRSIDICSNVLFQRKHIIVKLKTAPAYINCRRIKISAIWSSCWKCLGEIVNILCMCSVLWSDIKFYTFLSQNADKSHDLQIGR